MLPVYYYVILRPCLWFAKGDMISTKKMQKYFTAEAIKSLEDYDFIKPNFSPITGDAQKNNYKPLLKSED